MSRSQRHAQAASSLGLADALYYKGFEFCLGFRLWRLGFEGLTARHYSKYL